MDLPKGWAYAPFELLLDYEQPQKYIVESTEYSENYPTPVLTAGKSFIIGHTDETTGIYADSLPVIIFDDFTTATQFVTFPFKVKSSAMKMLQTTSPEMDIKYLFYRMQLIRHNTTTHKRYWISDYSKNVVELAPTAEQHRIVAKIDALFSELDKGVEMLQTIRQQLRTYRQAVLKWAFEGKLTENWRKVNEVTEEWKTVNIQELILPIKNALKAGPFGSSLKKECYVENGYKVYGQEQVIKGDETYGDYFIDEKKYDELITCKIVPNDILISLVGTIGKVLILSDNCLPGIINPRLIKVSLDEKIMLAKFFKYYFESGYLRTLYKAKAHGATMDVLNLTMIKELPFNVIKIINKAAKHLPALPLASVLLNGKIKRARQRNG